VNIVLLHPRRGLGDFNGASGGSFNAVSGEIIRGGIAPGTVCDHAHAETERLCYGRAAYFAVLGGKTAVTIVGQANISVGCAAQRGRVQCPGRNIFHGVF